MKKIENSFIDKYGVCYENLKTIIYSSINSLEQENMSLIHNNKESLIFKLNNSCYGYKIYKDYKEFPNVSHEEDCKIVSYLLQRQEFVEKTQFPTAVIVLQDPYNYNKQHVVGTLIPYYDNYINLFEIYNNSDKFNKDDIMYIYKQLIAILLELKEVNIIYEDIHMFNILIRLSDLDVKLIDFDNKRINKIGFEYNMINNLKELIYEFNIKFGIEVDNLFEIYNIEKLNKIINKKMIKIRK